MISYKPTTLSLVVVLLSISLTACVQDPQPVGEQKPVQVQQAQTPALDRTVLPIAAPVYAESKVLDVRDATPPPRFQVKAPDGAPNVVVVLVDDLGFAGTSTFGGAVPTPTFDRMASEGVHYNNFHTTAVCSPTRAAIKSGRNHHVNNMGGIIETGTQFPGNTGQIPTDVTPVAEMLRQSIEKRVGPIQTDETN